jgi:hypothetical protein
MYYNKTQYTNNTHHIPRSNNHSTQNDTNNKGHSTHNVYTPHTMNTITTQQIQLKLKLNKLILIKNKYTIHWTLLVMKYVMSWTDALTFHRDFPFIPLHYSYTPFTSSPQFTSLPLPFTSLYFTSLYFTSLHFTSLHFTSHHFWWLPPHLHFALFTTFLTFFLKLLDLQEGAPNTSAVSWFQGWMVLYDRSSYFWSPCI